jgi:hypothetical protein
MKSFSLNLKCCLIFFKQTKNIIAWNLEVVGAAAATQQLLLLLNPREDEMPYVFAQR